MAKSRGNEKTTCCRLAPHTPADDAFDTTISDFQASSSAVESRGNTPSSDSEAPFPKYSIMQHIRRFLCSISTCITLVFFIVVGISAMSIVFISRFKFIHVSESTLENAQEVSVQRINLQLEQQSQRILTIGEVFNNAALGNSLPNFGDFSIALSLVCSTLKHSDQDYTIRKLSLFSVREKVEMLCTHGGLPRPSVMTGGFAAEDYAEGTYIMNADFYYQQPLVLVTPLAKHKPPEDPTILALFDAAESFWKGEIDHIPHTMFWDMTKSSTTLLSFTYPLKYPFFKGNRTVVDKWIRADLNPYMMIPAHASKGEFGVRLMMLSLAFASERDPVISFNNWGQLIDDGSDQYTFDRYVVYLRVSGISDPLMKRAMEHIKISDLLVPGAKIQKSFLYKNAKAVVTAWRHETTSGLIAIMILATPHRDIAGPLFATATILTTVMLFTWVLLSILFFLFMLRWYAIPLRRLYRALFRSAWSPQRHSTRHTIRLQKCQFIILKEISELVTVYNKTMMCLKMVDTFLPTHGDGTMFDVMKRRACAATTASLQSFPSLHAGYTTMTFVHVQASCDFSNEWSSHYTNSSMIDKANEEGYYTCRHRVEQLMNIITEAAAQHHGYVHFLAPDNCCIVFAKEVTKHNKGFTTAHARRDALNAVYFCLALQPQLLKLDPSNPIRCWSFVDTVAAYTELLCIPEMKLNQFCFGCQRNIYRDLGYLLPMLGIPVCITDETAAFVRSDIRVLPLEAMEVTDAGYGAVIYEALNGSVHHPAWVGYEATFNKAFDHMLCGDYRSALDAFDSLAPMTSSLPAGLLPWTAAGGASPPYVPTYGTKQINRLMTVCVNKLIMHDNTEYVRRPLSTDFLRLLNVPPGERPLHLMQSSSDFSLPAAYADNLVRRKKKRSSLKPNTGEYMTIMPPSRAGTPAAMNHNGEKPPSKNVSVLRVQTNVSEDVRLESRLMLHVEPVEGTQLFVLCVYSSAQVDNNGHLWVSAKHSVKNTAEPTYKQAYLLLSSKGILAVKRFYPWRNSAFTKEINTNDIAGRPLPSPTREQITAAALLFPSHLMSDHTVGYLGYTVMYNGGVVPIIEYFPGGNLREMMSRYGRVLPTPTIIRYIVSILSGLQFLHSRRVVHGDVRPETVLVGTSGRCKLCGYFGNLRIARHKLLLPTSCYMSPEVARGGAPSAASDVYCAGLVLVEMLTGRSPWRWSPTVEADRSPSQLDQLLSVGGSAFAAELCAGNVCLRQPAAGAGSTLQYVYNACLQEDVNERPSAEDVLKGIVGA